MKKYLGALIVTVELDNGKKVLHILGDSYYSECEEDESTPYRFIQYGFGYIPLLDVVTNGMPNGEWYAKLKQWITDCSLDELNDIYEHYDNEERPQSIELCDLREDMPCGCYIILNPYHDENYTDDVCKNCSRKDSCDGWEARFCCKLCSAQGAEHCDDCNPMDI